MAPNPLDNIHGSGYTCIAVPPDGRYWYSGGHDELVRVWDTQASTDEPDYTTADSGVVTFLAATNTTWFHATAKGNVYHSPAGSTDLPTLFYQLPGGEEVCGLAVEPNGNRIAIAGAGNQIHVVSLSDTSSKVVLSGHDRLVRRVSWHPHNPWLVSCGADGRAIIWRLDRPDGQQLQRRLSVSLPRFDDATSLGHPGDCTAVWHPSHGNSFFIITSTGAIEKYSSEGELETFSLRSTATGFISAIAISPNGLYMAIAYPDRIVVCRMSSGSQISEHIHKPKEQAGASSTITQTLFLPIGNMIAWADTSGSFYHWDDPIPNDLAGPSQALSSKPAEADQSALMFDSIDDDADIAMEDDGAGADRGEDIDDERDVGYAKEMVNVTKAQRAFQPGATPWKKKKRYLTHNGVGFVEATQTDVNLVINVEFYDKSTRQGFTITDEGRLSFASLGERGAVFGSNPPASSKSEQARLIYRPYSSWNATTGWTLDLPEDERIVAVAAGGTPPTKSLRNASDVESEGAGCAVVALENGCIRFLGGSGIQQYIWHIGGDVISMVAGHEWVFVVHREGGTSLDGCQNLRYTIVALVTFELVQAGMLPLPRGRTLSWIGITEEGAPAIYDSEGLMSILDRFRRPTQGRWVPILDATKLERRKGKDESYWPIGLSSENFMCIILKGLQEYPDAHPRPIVQELPVRIPLWPTADIKATQLEEKFLRGQIHVNFLSDSLGEDYADAEVMQKELALDKELLMLINLAASSQQLQRALDLACLLHNPKSIEAAGKIAQRHSLRGLQDRLTDLHADRSQEDRYQIELEDRRSWSRRTEPIPAPRSRFEGPSTEDFDRGFLSSVAPRRALAPAVPLSRSATAFNQPQPESNFNRWGRPTLLATQDVLRPTAAPPSIADVDEEELMTTLSPGEKRKRAEAESLAAADLEGDRNPKRRLVETGSSKTGNPFAKKNPGPPSTALRKSGSFFAKAQPPEPARLGQAKPKAGSSLKPTAKQSTLAFNARAADNDAHKRSSKKQDSKAATDDSETRSESANAQATSDSGASAGDVETDQVDASVDTQADAPVDAMPVDDDEVYEWPASDAGSPPPESAPASTQTLVSAA
ncbi:hypothetical protein BKA62DRAFT_681220 [Auriculariales sp. MPI-PUGE-AT-0066]|nr:hypothetical protein BKA62DRAFT_681220 [Auriculariales sp. MPI-PUGE-AT-0066]